MAQRNRIILISLVISVVLGFLAGFLGGRLATSPVREKPATAVIRAERFQLADANGLTRGSFEVDPRGIARLVLRGQNGASLVSLATDPQGAASLQMGDEKGQSAVVLKTEPQGAQTIALFHEGKPRVTLEVQKNGDSGIDLYDKGKRLIALGLTNQEDPHLTFFGENQKMALELLSKKNGDRSLTLDGKDGIPRIVLGLKNDQKAALGLFDRQGKTRAALMDDPSLFLLKNGKVVRTLP
jgi:ribosomal protein S18 acetylase RimI-like enzyme